MAARLRRLPFTLLLAVFILSAPAATSDDSCATAVSVALMPQPNGTNPTATIQGTFELPGDEDWFRIDAPANHAYEFFFFSGGIPEPRARLIGPDCTTVLAEINSFNDLESTSLLSSISPLYIQVENITRETGDYSIGLRDNGPAVDDVPDQLGPDSPVISTDGTERVGRIDYVGDLDAFRMSTEPHQVLRVTVTCPQPDAQASLRIYSGEQYLATLNAYTEQWGSAPRTASILLPVPASGGDLTLLVGSANPQSVYRIAVTVDGTVGAGDDYPDTCDAAAPLDIGDPAFRLVSQSDDADWFAVPLQSGRLYQFRARNLTDSGSNSRLSLSTAGCLLVSSASFSWDGSLVLNHRAETDEPVRLAFISRTLNTPILCELEAIDLGPTFDDFGNTLANAAPLNQQASPVIGLIDYADDSDLFRLSAQPGHEYRLEFRALGGAAWSLEAELLDAEGHAIGQIARPINGIEPLQWYGQSVITPPGQTDPIYLRISASTPIGYQIRATDLGPVQFFDGPSTCAAAVSMPVDGLTQRLDLPPHAAAVIARTLAPARRYQVAVANRSLADSAGLHARNDCGTTIFRVSPTEWDTGDLTYQFETPSAHSGNLTLSIDASDSDQASSRQVTISDVGAATDRGADAPDQPLTAPIRRAAIHARTDHMRDVDFYHLRLRPDRLYRLQFHSRFTTLPGSVRIGQFDGHTIWHITSVDSDTPAVWTFWQSTNFYPWTASPAGDLLLTFENMGSTTDVDLAFRIYDVACPADWNADAATTIDDLLLFLTDWLAGNADFDDQPEPGTTLGDLFAYLNSWFVGCAGN